MQKEEFFKKYFPYIKWCVITVALVVVMFVYKKPFNGETAKKIFADMSDCFAVPGVVLSGIGLLSYFASLGAYDALAYSFSNFSLHSLIPGRHKDKHETLYEYKKAKDEKGRNWLRHILYIGLVTLGIAVILLIIYAIL